MNEHDGVPGVTITLADIYEKLIVVETKLAPILDPDVGVIAR